MQLLSAMKSAFVLFVLVAQFCACQLGHAFEASGPKTTPLLSDIAVLRDPQGPLNIADIRNPANAHRFSTLSLESGGTDFGFTNDTIWLKLSLSRNAASPKEWVLEIPYLGLDSVTLYNPDGTALSIGGQAPANQKPIFQRFDAFPITLSTEPEIFYLRVRSQYAVSIPLLFWNIPAYSRAKLIDNLIQVLYFGGILALAAYNLLLFISLRERRYLIYVLFATSIGMGMFSGNGYGHLLLWPNSPDWNSVSQSFFFALSAGFCILFTQDFLRTPQVMPRTNLCLNGLAIFYFLLSLSLALSVSIELPREVIHKLLMAGTLPTGIFVALVAIQSMTKGDVSAKYILLAFGILWTGGSIAALRALGLVPTNAFTAYALQIASAFEVLLLSFALANQIHVERKLRHSAENMHEQYVRFNSLISHEFRTPLNVIESQAALLEREHDNSLANIKKRTHVIMSAVQQLSFLFTRWAQADRLKQAMNQINPSAIDLYVWLGSVIDRCRDFYPNHPIHLEVDPETQTVWADNGLLQIAIMNLIDNASKYSPDHSVIQVGTIMQDGMTGIYVTDQGKGIAAEQHKNIFDAYTRLDSDTTAPGIGLGLAFVKKIMALHGGHVDLSSRLGAGSTFVLWFSNQRER